MSVITGKENDRKCLNFKTVSYRIFGIVYISKGLGLNFLYHLHLQMQVKSLYSDVQSAFGSYEL
jgi:hypothetical protein